MADDRSGISRAVGGGLPVAVLHARRKRGMPLVGWKPERLAVLDVDVPLRLLACLLHRHGRARDTSTLAMWKHLAKRADPPRYTTH